MWTCSKRQRVVDLAVFSSSNALTIRLVLAQWNHQIRPLLHLLTLSIPTQEWLLVLDELRPLLPPLFPPQHLRIMTFQQHAYRGWHRFLHCRIRKFVNGPVAAAYGCLNSLRQVRHPPRRCCRLLRCFLPRILYLLVRLLRIPLYRQQNLYKYNNK